MDDAYFKRKMCKIGGLMFNPLSQNVEILDVKPLEKTQRFEPTKIDIACLEYFVLFSMLFHW